MFDSVSLLFILLLLLFSKYTQTCYYNVLLFIIIIMHTIIHTRGRHSRYGFDVVKIKCYYYLVLMGSLQTGNSKVQIFHKEQ